jgi:circadian clock protein KaiC
MSDGRTLSGEPRLDQVLGGGIPRNAIVMLMGQPGAGKTILAQQYLFKNASKDRPGLYLTTASEPVEKVLRYGQTLDFFDADAVGGSVFYESLAGVLSEKGPQGIFDRIEHLIKERKPGILVVDSYKAIHTYTDRHDGNLRDLTHRLGSMLSAFPVTTFLLGEYTSNDVARYPEFAVADAIISLEVTRTSQREKRDLQVVKLRGSGFLSGHHAYRIGNAGLRVFPRLADPRDVEEYDSRTDRLASGVDGLDRMMDRGIRAGSSTLVLGPAGSGKTLLGLHFILAGAARGEPGLIATFQENPVQLNDVLKGFGWSLDPDKVELMYRAPVDLHIDEWVYDLLDTVKQGPAQRVLIDSLGDLRLAAGDKVRFREYMYSILQRLSRTGTTLMMTDELAPLTGDGLTSDPVISHLSDNVVHLGIQTYSPQLIRAVSVLKTRGTSHDAARRQYEITSEGFKIGEPADLVAGDTGRRSGSDRSNSSGEG